MSTECGPSGAIENVWYQWYRFARTRDELNRADAIIALNNAIGDLASWHPDYDAETGEIKGIVE